MTSPADEHRRIAGAFTTTVEGTGPESWDLPAPPEGWVAREVVRHLVEWFPAFLDGATGIKLPAVHRSTTTPSAPGVPRPTPCRPCLTTLPSPTASTIFLTSAGCRSDKRST